MGLSAEFGPGDPGPCQTAQAESQRKTDPRTVQVMNPVAG